MAKDRREYQREYQRKRRQNMAVSYYATHKEQMDRNHKIYVEKHRAEIAEKKKHYDLFGTYELFERS